MIVLQHNPPPIMAMVLRRAFACLRSGGLAVFQVPTYAPRYRFQTGSYLRSGVPTSGIEMHFFPQSKLFELVATSGCRMVEVVEDAFVGDPKWLSNTFVVAK
jgi:hypothetical protein